ncbi:hypothetical protein MMC13_006926 [Lambiella insularis]|nr:hypothetical protein [Lambiella insularis]
MDRRLEQNRNVVVNGQGQQSVTSGMQRWVQQTPKQEPWNALNLQYNGRGSASQATNKGGMERDLRTQKGGGTRL